MNPNSNFNNQGNFNNFSQGNPNNTNGRVNQ